MRPITRNVLIVILVVVVLLLALGALPGLLKSGDPYYVQATAVEDSMLQNNETAVNASDLSGQRYEYANGALASVSNGTGTSDPYWKGPIGIKGAFTHSPFDEMSALRTQHPNATRDSSAFVRNNGTLYRLTVTQDA